MKRYGNLYSQIWDIDNIREAHSNARRGKGHYTEVQMVDADPEKYLTQIQAMLRDKTFRNSPYQVFTKTDSGKEREIYKLPYYPDRIIHHCVTQVLEPIWMRTFISDTYSSLKDRGIHKGVSRVKVALRDRENTQYCLKFDVRKFYPSVDHETLKAIIRRKIKDPDVLWLLDEVIDSADGIPIGNYLSQYFGNLYLAHFDHWMKEVKSCRYYFRYCDDVVVLHRNKAFLQGLLDEVQARLATTLKLVVKNNYQVFPVDIRGVDFLGYRFFHGYSLLRKSIARRFKIKVQLIKRNWLQMNASQVVNGTMSYWGWMRHGNCLHLTKSLFDVKLQYIIAQTCSTGCIRDPLRKMRWCLQ
jgi:RNA-directed DNA polymerase